MKPIKTAYARQAQTKAPTEGLLFVSFVFDGVVYRKQHQFTKVETDAMKLHVLEQGDAAADTALFRSAIWYAGRAAENLIAKGALEYMKRNQIQLEIPMAKEDEAKAIDEAIARQLKR